MSDDKTKFLVCEPGAKYGEKNVTSYLMPGGRFEEKTVEECLKAEIKEELNCEVDFKTLEFVNEFVDVAASNPDRDVSIKLYKAVLIGQPTPSSEIGTLHWIGKDDAENERVSPIIRNKIIPNLVSKEILR